MMGRGEKAQASMEFLVIFGFVFLMMLPLIVIFFDQAGSIEDSINQNQVRNIAMKLADKAEAVYYLGSPSKATIKAEFPPRIETIFIGSRQITFRYRNWEGGLSDIASVTLVNITGNLSITPGIHTIEIEATGEEVSIIDS